MKKKLRISAIALVVFAVPMQLLAWECSLPDGTSNGTGGCYVETVKMITRTSVYEPIVLAKILDPKTRTAGRGGITEIRLERHSATSKDMLEATISQLIYALTTGLPVNFTCRTISSKICYLDKLIVSRPAL